MESRGVVRQYYLDEITDISEQELEPIYQPVAPPVCLIGGWAVHLPVNDGILSFMSIGSTVIEARQR